MSVQKTYSSEKEITEIWKLFRETDRKMQETDRKMQETSREVKETSREVKETSREMKEGFQKMLESSKETDRQMKETALQMKETDRRLEKLDQLFNGQWGKLMESLVKGDLIKLLQKRGIDVHYILRDEERQGTWKERQWEFDIVAVNGKELVVVEVKTTLKTKDVDHFIKKLQIFTKLRPRYKDSKIYGAVAYLKANADSDKYAEKKKLFVIRATGSSASITNAKNFKPKNFEI
ncbi:MAG: hypothetical protein OXK80_00020 [Bdellovibrionales bacterium]|nr:hypothetical protein [Bdellovibrionales bacterium]